MHRVEIVANTASMSLVFGGLIIKNHIGYKNRIFSCRWSKKIVDVSQYYRLQALGDIKRVLGLGLPVAFGFTVFRSIFASEVEETGNIPFPSSNDSVAGGHAVVAVGFDDAKKYIIIRNSWGKNWGDDGYGYLPYKYFEVGLTRDYWILVKTKYESLKSAL